MKGAGRVSRHDCIVVRQVVLAAGGKEGLANCHELVAGHRLQAGLERSERAEARGSGGNRVNVGLKGRRLS